MSNKARLGLHEWRECLVAVIRRQRLDDIDKARALRALIHGHVGYALVAGIPADVLVWVAMRPQVVNHLIEGKP